MESVVTFQGPPGFYCPVFASMRENGELCDFTIKTKNESLQVHSVIVAAAMPYFRALFRSNMTEAKRKEVDLEHLDPSSVKCVIEFLYTNELKLTIDNVLCLLETSMYLHLDVVIDACFQFMLERIDSDVVFAIREYACRTNKVDMMHIADNYIVENFEDVSTSEWFIDLPFPALEKFVLRDDLFVMNEEVVFEAILRWVKGSEGNQLLHLPQLLQHVRMHLLTPEFLSSRVSADDLIRASPACEKRVSEAKKFCEMPEDQLVPYNFTTGDRICKKKHHLKCFKLMNCGMYAVCFSGESRKTFFTYYDSVHRKWTVLFEDVLCDASALLGAVCTEEDIYVIEKKRILRLRLETLQLEQLKYNSRRFEETGMVYHQNSIYFIGGTEDMTRSILTFNPTQCTTAEVGTMISARKLPNAVSLDDFIYIIGGFHDDGTLLSSAEKYNPETGHSEEIAPMLSRRHGYNCTALNGKIYVSGGFLEDDTIMLSVATMTEVYDPVTNQWSSLNGSRRIRGLMYQVPYAGKLYAFGNVPNKEHFQIETCTAHEEWKPEEIIPCCSGSCKIMLPVVTNSATHFTGVDLESDDEFSDSDEEDETSSDSDEDDE